MPTFENADQAKNYLIGQILAEAKREGIKLSKIEREMLAYSSEDEPRFAALNQTFEQEYDAAEYEEKIARLIRSILCTFETDLETWDEATACLLEGDHYLSVMIGMAENIQPQSKERPLYDHLKLIATAIAIVATMFALIFFWHTLWDR